MPIPLNYSGNDDGALKQLIADAGLVLVPAGNTHNGINALADLAAVARPVPGADRWMLEQLAAAISVGPVFSYSLNDDGTLAAAMGAQPLPTDAPAHVVGRYTLQSAAVVGHAMPASFSDGAPVPAAGIVAVEMLISAAPHAADMTGSYLIGLNLIAVAAGMPVDGMKIAVRIYAGMTALTYDHIGGSSLQLAALDANVAEGLRIGLYYNTSTGLVGAVVGGIDYGYIAGEALALGEKIAPTIDAWSNFALTAPIAGAEVVATLLHHAADMMQTYPAGAVDIFGLPI